MSREFVHRNRLVICALLALILISCRRGVLAQQDCGQPSDEERANGNFVGDTTHQGTAALLCNPGYEGGGNADCNDGTWTIPPCTAKECNEPIAANAVFYGSRKFGEYNNITCNDGYEGSAVITCTADKIWENVPTCTPVDCGDPGIANGNNVGSNLFGVGAFISCSAGYTGGGLLACQADGTWDSKPPCNPKQCAKQAITNGEMVGALEYNSADSRVECDNGYEGDAAITCTTSATWQLPLPECNPRVCSTDPTITFGVLEGDRFYSGSAFVNCDDGYEGDGAATCLPDGTWDLANLPACTAKDCLQPDPAIANGFLSGSTKYGEGASISCDAGYEVVGDDTALCQTDGTWAALPTCDPVECPPVTVTNGAFSGSREYNSQADIICNEGYVGDAPIECQTDASWGQIPTCDPIDCNALTVPHGQFFGDTFYLGSTTILCDTGYDLVGTAVCGTSGTWDSVPTCDPKDCLAPTIGFGSFSGDTTYDGSASVTCDAGYDGSGPAVCGSDGSWQVLPTCVPKDCGPTGVPFSTLLGSSKFEEGAFISCITGYTGGGAATCNAFGIWEVLPLCNPKDCLNPTIQFGSLSDTSETVFNGAATVECDLGYELESGDGTATCQDDATWATLPVCIPVDCGAPTLPNGFLINGKDETFYTGTAEVGCDVGHEGGGVATCLNLGTWDTLPVCNPKDCGDLTDPVHGNVAYPATTYLNEALYTCLSLWQLNGSSTLTCNSDGNWEPEPPTCDDIDCPALVVPTSGSLSTDVVKVGTEVTVTCDQFYTLFGDVTIACETGGTWNTTVGTCRKDCSVLTVPTNGAISSENIFEGTVVDVSCNTGYTLEGSSQTTCLPGGNWDVPLPVCTEDCPSLPDPPNGVKSTNVLSQGTAVIVTCDTGYTRFGAAFLLCLMDATWNNQLSECRKDCPALSDPANGNRLSHDVSQESVVPFACNAGYTLFGDFELTCQSDSTWDFDIPVCLKDCRSIVVPINGVANTTSVIQTTVVSFECDQDYTLFGVDTLVCRSDATWNGVEPECRKDCRTLVPPVNGGLNNTAVKQTTEVPFYCDQLYTLFGSALLVCQADATWNDTEPLCKEDCPFLSPPSNGFIHGELLSQGIVIGVSCNTTYTLFGEDQLTCQSDASWDYPLPECKKDCPILNDPSNGFINTSVESQGTVVGVECDTDYTLFGNSEFFCQSDASWDSVLPECKENCRLLSEPINGFTDNLNVRQETIVIFDCDSGYTLFGDDTLLCQSNATWNSTEPTCEKDCPVLTIPNGNISTTEVIMTTEVTIVCSANYSLEGESMLTCITNGLWDYAVPLCTKDCRPLIPPTNGGYFPLFVSQDSQITFSCDTNYTLFGAAVLTCLDSASWDFPEPTCRPDCPILTKPQKAIFSTTDTYEGIVLVISCESGFSRFGNQNLTCLPGGVWDKSLPTCRKDCKALAYPPNGAFSPSDVKEGTVLTVVCDTGYTLLGDAVINCLPGGLWDNYPPDCHRECGPLTNPTHGEVAFSDGTTLDHAASYACYTGYDLSHSYARYCLSDGSWSYIEPTCVKRDCGNILGFLNGVIQYSNDATTYLEVATFSCNPGYILNGFNRRMCKSDYTWGGTSPVCVIKDCLSLPNPENGNVNTVGGTTYGEVARYYCNVGYSLVGMAERTCEADGRWSGTPPVCEIRDCGNLTDPTNGSVSFTLTTYNELVSYTCDPGFTLTGSSSRICQQDATWSSSAPNCIIKDCGSLTAPDYGSVSFSNGQTTYLEIANFTCVTGYSLIGDETRTCGAGGRWGGTTPTCIIKDCGHLENPSFGTVNTGSGTTYTKTANYFCNTGYVLDGVSLRSCQADGQWSDETPVCNIRECPSLDNLTNGVVSAPLISYNEIATYSCDAGYNLVGISQRVCQQDGSWSDTAPVCEIKDCGTPPSIKNGVYATPNGTTFSSYSIYSCNLNYGLVGNDAVVCQTSGYWAIPPRCDRDCGLPTVLENGDFQIQTDTLTDAIATYSCDSGYTLVGDADVTCQVNGQWEAPPNCAIIPEGFNSTCHVTEQCLTERSTCRSDGLGATRCLCAATGSYYNSTSDICLAYCGFVTAPTNGLVALPLIPAEDQEVSYSCNNGFALSDVSLATRTCLATGQWDKTAPLCIVGCPEPPELENGNVNTSFGLATGKKIYYSCNSNFTLVGDSFRECLSDTTWNGDEPICAINCPMLSAVQYGTIDLSAGYWENSIATYYCQKDHAMVGTATRICESTGRWSGTEPVCLYAIFPDVLLVFGALLLFLIIVDIFVVIFLIYLRYGKKKDPDEDEMKHDFDQLDDENHSGKQHVKDVTPVEKTEPGIPPMTTVDLGPTRSTFKMPRNINVESETDPKPFPHIPRKSKQKKSVLDGIPRPKPIQKGLRALRKARKGKLYGQDNLPFRDDPLSLAHSTPRHAHQQSMDEFKDDTIDIDKLLKEDATLTPSGEHTRRSTADEEKVKISNVNSTGMETSDKMVLMDCDDEIPTTSTKTPPIAIKSGMSLPSGSGENGQDIHLRKATPMGRPEAHSPFSVQLQSEV